MNDFMDNIICKTSLKENLYWQGFFLLQINEINKALKSNQLQKYVILYFSSQHEQPTYLTSGHQLKLQYTSKYEMTNYFSECTRGNGAFSLGVQLM